MEVVDLKKKDENNVVHAKFKNRSTILGEILDCKDLPLSKLGLAITTKQKNLKLT